MIDLHSHILPGLDDGPTNLDFSLALARAAVEAGTQMIVATPHIRSDYPIEIDEIEPRVELLNQRLVEDGLPLRVLPAGEIGWAQLEELSDAQLSKLRLGSGDYLLVESPYGRKPVDIEGALGGAVERGYKAVLAHPERCPLFQRDVDRLASLVERGVLCSVTAASLLGRFGEHVRRFTLELFTRGLVHDVASDAHDHVHRPPGLGEAFERAESELPGISAHAAWYTVTAPVAILAGRQLPPVPRVEARSGGRLRRLLGGARG